MPTVSIPGNSNTYKINIGENIFDSLKSQGVELMHGCLAGSCGACRVEILKGAEFLDPISAGERSTLNLLNTNYERIHGKGALDGKTIRLSCQVRINSEGHIELKELT